MGSDFFVNLKCQTSIMILSLGIKFSMRELLVCRLMVSTSVIHVPTPEGWKAELAWVTDTYQTFYTQSGHRSAMAKHRRPTTEPLRQLD